MTDLPLKLQGVSDLREFFRTNQTPIYFISPTAFNLLGIDQWVRNFHYVTWYDSFEGSHPGVFVPEDRSAPEFESIEDICNHLLAHPEVIRFVRSHGPGGRAVFVMFDEQTEALAASAGLRVAHPPAGLRHRLDSKIVTTRLGDEAGVPSVPNVLGRAASYPELMALAGRAGLGEDLVVQMPYGDSGKTTFFVRSQADWDKAAAKEPLAGQDLKVMRRIDHRAIAVEAVLTRHGTHDWHRITSPTEAFYLRILGPGDYRYRGADLGALVTRTRLQTDDNRLEDRCQQWITGIRAQFAGAPPVPPQAVPASPTSFKMA